MIGSRNEKSPTTPSSSSSATSSTQYTNAPTSLGSEKNPADLPTAVIGPKIRFKGELIGEEDLLIQGQVEGTIDLKNHNLTVGDQGIIKANAKAKTIIIEGKVDGDLHGEERVVIKESSNVSGNITAERVSLEDGAKFRGSIDMDTKSKATSTASEKTTSSKATATS